MSAPETNIPKQTRRHAPSLIAIAAAVAFGVGLVAWWVLGTSSGDTPDTAAGGTLIAPQDAPASGQAPADPTPPTQ